MSYQVKVFIRPKKGILDPQGKAVEGALKSMGYKGVQELRVGKLIEFSLDGQPSAAQAEAVAREMSEKLLSNPIFESFTLKVE